MLYKTHIPKSNRNLCQSSLSHSSFKQRSFSSVSTKFCLPLVFRSFRQKSMAVRRYRTGADLEDLNQFLKYLAEDSSRELLIAATWR